MKTNDLIAALAADSASPNRPISATMAYALAGAMAAAALVFVLAAGIRPDITDALASPRFLLKPLAMGLLAVAATIAVRRLARPDAEMGKLLYVLALVPLVLLIGVVFEFSTVTADERWSRLVGDGFIQCLGLIIIIGVAPLAIMLWGLRQGAPANPVLAGAMAGVAAAGLAALFYAAHCLNDSPFYVAVWYSLATLVLAGTGAVAGSRLLRW